MKDLVLYLIFVLVAFARSSDGDLVINHRDIESSSTSANYSAIGTFWQITDIHWDLEYSEFGDKKDMCHESSEDPQNKSVGYYGNYLCDAPYPLIYSAFQAMKKFEPQPNFILWTGDNSPHTADANFSVIFRTLKNLTEELVSVFGSEIPLIPVLGNHDSFPKDDYPPSGETFYSRYLYEGGWKEIISAEEQKDFKKGGYYKFPLPLDVDVFVLNTNLYYKFNELGQGLEDPGGQFNWMRSNLKQAKDAKRKVIIAAHAPPGYWERNVQVPFLNESYNDEYVDILNSFGDVIMAQIYGHEHSDSFRIFKTDEGKLKSVGFLAPSLTPWFPTRLKGGTAINPSLRLYFYSHSSLLDYVQYHLNLTEANDNRAPTEACLSSSVMGELDDCEGLGAQWKEYYRAREAFEVRSLHVEEMARVYERLISDDNFFQKYYLRNSAGVRHGYCDNECKRSHFCAISHIKIQSDPSQCSDKSSPGHSLSHTGVALVSIGVSLTLMLSAMFVVISIRRRRMKRGLRNSQAKWGTRHSGYRPLLTADTD